MHFLFLALAACTPQRGPPNGSAATPQTGATVGRLFTYGPGLDRSPCVGERLGIAEVRGYGLAFSGDDLTLVAIRSDATVPGFLWKTDPACVASWEPAAPYEARQIFVEYRDNDSLPATTALIDGFEHTGRPSEATATALLQAWTEAGLRQSALLQALPADLALGWHGPGRLATGQHLSTGVFTITVSPPGGDGGDALRSLDLVLHAGLREPDAATAEGEPISTQVPLLPDAALGIVAELGATGYFASSTYFVEPRVQVDASVPEGAAVEAPAPPDGPYVSVQVTVNDDAWYHRHTEYWPWDAATRARLARLATRVGGQGEPVLGRLVGQLPE